LRENKKAAALLAYYESFRAKPNEKDYLALKEGIHPGCGIANSDGTDMTKQQFYLASIQCTPPIASAYYDLAETLKPDQSVRLADQTRLTKKQLLAKSIELLTGSEMYVVKVYLELGRLMEIDEKIVISRPDAMPLAKLDRLNKR
jgi:hypothetical protein